MNTKESFPQIRIVVTGIGAVSAAGNDVAANFANMCAATRSPKLAPEIFSCEFRKPVFECDSSVLDSALLPRQRTLALAIKALEEALADAGLDQNTLKKKKVGVCVGTTVACTLNNLDFYKKVRDGEKPAITPLERYIYGDISRSIAKHCKIDGPVATIANACASGTNTLALAEAWLNSGYCDIVIAGGADELNSIPYCGFNSLQLMSSEPCMPFDCRRNGLTLGEGAGILILEKEDSAEQRGKKPEVLLLSTGGASDAYHITGPHPEGRGMKTAVNTALEAAGITLSELDYINAHGTSTIDNDRTESHVFAEFADSAGRPLPFSSTKYYTGHTLGASGAIEAVICVKGIREGCFPGQPEVSDDGSMPALPASANVPYNGNAVLSTSMAFGGSCAALVFAAAPFGKNKRSQTLSGGTETAGIGIIGSFGLGKEAFTEAIQAAEKTESANFAGYIPEDAMSNPALKRIKRRADKLSMAMLYAAVDAVDTASSPKELNAKTAVVVATGFGAVNTTFKFLEDLLEFGETAPSPTHFSNSVHNAPAFYITSFLKLTGLSVTFTGLNSPFAEALKYSEYLIGSGKFEQVLLVAGDETGEILRRMTALWFEAHNQPVPDSGEGAAAFLLRRKTEKSVSCGKSSEKTDNTKSLVEKIFGFTPVNDAFEAAAVCMKSC